MCRLILETSFLWAKTENHTQFANLRLWDSAKGSVCYLTRSKKEDFDAILAYLAYLAEDFGSQRSDVLRANNNLLYGDFAGLFTSQNLLPGKKFFSSSEEKLP